MSFDGKIYQDLTTDEGLRSHRQTFGQDRAGFGFQHHRLVILSLGLLNAALLIAAAVIGVYCANAKDLQVSDLAATPLILEMNFLRNHTAIVKAKAEFQRALVKERADFVQIKQEVMQKKALTDSLEQRIRNLQAEKTNLQSNRTVLEKNCGRCPLEWVLLKTGCYYFSKSDAASRKNWSDSRADCVSKGSDLVVINSLEEQLSLNVNFPRLQSSSSMWWMNGFWIGLTATENQGAWLWVNNKTEEATMYWRAGEPRNSEAHSGTCAAFLSDADSMKTWYSGNCQQNQLNWICEMEPRRI
ncbi:CD209 antigen-like protein E isoform X2 [Kryptolebias marmoratus]|uniref:CD209 antigen-like protein E isoform X2 n=1 Tax=Kryptolebias marmoratus TaxID=37003 RepID=UPI000D5304F2|nr:CD209 antigen-like protein E isoform X2 [Kryptolebias marmoratus]